MTTQEIVTHLRAMLDITNQSLNRLSAEILAMVAENEKFSSGGQRARNRAALLKEARNVQCDLMTTAQVLGGAVAYIEEGEKIPSNTCGCAVCVEGRARAAAVGSRGGGDS